MMHFSWRFLHRHSIEILHHVLRPLTLVFMLGSFGLPLAMAQQPRAVSRALPIDAALRSFRLSEPNLDIELVIAEPRVVNPIAVTWDADSYLYVLEIVGYGSQRPMGRVKRLVDLDGDWQYDRGSFFARNLAWPRAMLPWRAGLLVYAGGEIIYLRDTNDDGEADERRVVLTGLGEPDGKALLTGGLVQGIDNWIYAANQPACGAFIDPRQPIRPWMFPTSPFASCQTRIAARP